MISIDQYHTACLAAYRQRQSRKNAAATAFRRAAERSRYWPVDMRAASARQSSEDMAADQEYDTACRAAAATCEV